MSKYNEQILASAKTQVLGAMLLEAGENEQQGSRAMSAFIKAANEVEANDTIELVSGVLSFVSRYSNEMRFVTIHGCSTECRCGNRLSYHQALFNIVARYRELLSEKFYQVRTGKMNEQAINSMKQSAKNRGVNFSANYVSGTVTLNGTLFTSELDAAGYLESKPRTDGFVNIPAAPYYSGGADRSNKICKLEMVGNIRI